ncbi:MAG: sigma-70 family RNA polymerase sigma factor [Phycisphaerales bacterium]|nr:sigma-70 family RNA polymerase sigma factor [Phycisphaerales bacterium]
MSHPDTQADDLRLVSRIRAGDRAAMSDLLTRYQDRLYGVCVRMLGDRDAAQDLAQDAMVKVIQGLDTFDGQSRVSTWIIKVTMNACLSHLRGQRLRRHAPLHGIPVSSQGSGGFPERARGSEAHGVERGSIGTSRREREQPPDLNVQLQEERSLLGIAISELEPEQRALLILRDVQGLDYEQIADAIGTPLGTVKSRLFRARLALREKIEHHRSGKAVSATEKKA